MLEVECLNSAKNTLCHLFVNKQSRNKTQYVKALLYDNLSLNSINKKILCINQPNHQETFHFIQHDLDAQVINVVYEFAPIVHGDA